MPAVCDVAVVLAVGISMSAHFRFFPLLACPGRIRNRNRNRLLSFRRGAGTRRRLVVSFYVTITITIPKREHVKFCEAHFDDEPGGICLTSCCEASIKAPVVRQSVSFEVPGV